MFRLDVVTILIGLWGYQGEQELAKVKKEKN